jgi:hypothetical protein
VTCSGGDVTTLPATPPQDATTASPDGSILPEPRQTIPQGTAPFEYQAGTQTGVIRIVARLIGGDDLPIGEPSVASITLLEMGSLESSFHIFADPGDMSGNDSDNIILFSLPGGTPLGLYPRDDNAPNARRAAIRVWVPSSVVVTDEAGQKVLMAPIPPGTSVSVDLAQPPTLSNPAGTTQTFSNGANGLPVTVVEDTGDYALVRLVGWVLAGAPAEGG